MCLPAERRGSAGPEVVDLAALAGLVLDDWQAWFLTEALSEQPNGQWSAFEAGLIVSRQCGKGGILEARQLAGLTILGERLQIHTAHEFKTCYEHFLRMVNLVESNHEIDRNVLRIRRGAGEQAIEMRSGQRLRFVARSGSSGKGMSGDTVYLDEAFALTPPMMGALLPTLSARPNPQVWYTSSAPYATSTVLHRLRDRAVRGGTDRLLFASWEVDAGSDPADVENWYAAVPALGIRIDEDFIRAELDALPVEEFMRERLSVPETPQAVHESTIPNWDALADGSSRIVSHHAWALAVSPLELGAQWSSIGMAGRREDGLLHVEWLKHAPGTGWVVEAAKALYVARPIPLRVHKSGPEGALIKQLVEAGVEVESVSSMDVAQACGAFVAAAVGTPSSDGQEAVPPSLRHLGQPSLTLAVRSAVLRSGVDGAVVWSQRKSSIEITPLQAVTVAVGGVPAAVEPWLFA
jgi:hypothetical protein